MRQPDRDASGFAVPAGRRLPELPGVLSADQLVQTGRAIAAGQQPDGSIGWPDGHVDAWNHVECAMALSVCGLREEARRAYGWLAATQRSDGSWPVQAAAGTTGEPATESNHAAYCAVGVWHELLVTGDDAFVAAMWPVVRAAVGFVLRLQTDRGEVIWRRHADGTPDDYALLTGCASMYQSLHCAIALAEYVGEPQPRWQAAAARLGHAVACHRDAFADKSRFSMDWYYPVLAGAVRGTAAEQLIKAGWDTFVVPGLGVRCVSDEPWVTAAETCELALALDALGRTDQARGLLEQIQFLRAPDGSYWTGWQFANRKHYPYEQSSYTAAAVVLAADAVAGSQAPGTGTSAAGIFREAGGRDCTGPADPEACGCPPWARSDAVTGPL